MGLTRIWLMLLALTAATTALAFVPGPAAAAALLAVALLKARTILAGFLHLDRATGWRAAFTVPLAIWLVLIWGLHVI
ncbi:cytochrome C oxidase subunit IV family protein [Paracoccus sp. PS-1]|uniref:cytochrome C oxidase subunit IV family protein n=1 Tax=unclassified Paracoccus (in: a-proteobacteria) TaxID=2688777 RepID=UPI00048BD4ED|nr:MULTISPECIES: cytochrome C oxidase subunit IV family protein [unclassified Paracoccus (in: a-proteobacteria)]MDQ7260310.1 cytochrome C oxidase subunit IV family protein [Paracoccus sp. PS1]